MTGPGVRTSPPLLERTPELDAIERRLENTWQGEGGLLLIEGPAGIGKTRLLWETRRLAAASGFNTLGARCDELEGSVAFGLASQLLIGPLHKASPADRERLLGGAAKLAAPLLLGEEAGASLPPVGDPSQALLNGLTWLVSNLAAERPLVLLVDDAHWADQESLRWLHQLEKRIAEVPVLIAMTVRRGELEAAEEILTQLAASPETAVVRPDPLSEEATAALLAHRFEEPPDPRLSSAAHRVTGGNPLLLDALALELLAQDAGTGARAAELAERLVPESLIRTVLLRLRRLPDPARPIAEALTVLGQAPLQTVAALAGAAEEAAEGAIEALETAELIAAGDELRFAHPIIRTTIYEQVSPRRRHRFHVEAARLLRLAGANPERIAPHLMAAGEVEVPGGAEILVEAGRRVYSLGAPAATVRYLLRALELDPDPGVRAEIQLHLGAAAIRALDPTAIDYLRRAVTEAPDGAARRSALMELARGQLATLDLDGATVTFEEALALSRGDAELELSAEAELASAQLNLNRFAPAAQRVREARQGVAGDTAAERKLLAVAAFAAAQSNEPATEVLALAGAALGNGALIAEQTCASVIVIEVLLALIMVDGYDLAGPALEQGIADARERGWPIGFATASALRSWMHLRRGNLAAAEADARAADEVRALHGATPLDPFVSAFLIDIATERGDLDTARALLAERCPSQVPDAAIFQLVLFARGRSALAAGDLESGLADVLEVGRRELGLGGTTPAALPWRSLAAGAMAALGRRDEAQRLVGGELTLAEELGTPRAIGIALRGVALAADADTIPTLERSVAVLESAQAPLEQVRSLTELGAAIRREGRQREAREPLRRAAALASSCGASGLEQRATDELGATGPRQRRTEASEGIGALTPSEMRAARMAAAGRSNKQIAQDLFVTARTIEIHLTRAYRKLGIRSRRELAAALEGVEAPSEGEDDPR